MNKLKKFGKYLGVLVGGTLGLTVASQVGATADTELVAGLASTTAIFTDNYGEVISWIVGIFAITIVVALVVRALFFSKGQALGMLGGRRRRR